MHFKAGSLQRPLCMWLHSSKKHSYTCFTAGMVLNRWWAAPGVCPKTLSHQTREYSSSCSYAIANSKWAVICLLLRFSFPFCHTSMIDEGVLGPLPYQGSVTKNNTVIYKIDFLQSLLTITFFIKIALPSVLEIFNIHPVGPFVQVIHAQCGYETDRFTQWKVWCIIQHPT